jgi:hypothetical protein
MEMETRVPQNRRRVESTLVRMTMRAAILCCAVLAVGDVYMLTR